MPVTAYTPNHLLSLEAVKIGQLIQDINSPEQDFHAPQSSDALDPKIIKTTQASFSETLKRSEGTSLNGFLATLLAAHYKNSGMSTTRIESALTKIYQLQNPTDVFYDMCKFIKTRRWLERAIGKGKTVYMVVGLHILTDAEIRSEDSKASEAGGHLGVSNLVGGIRVESSDFQAGSARTESSSKSFCFVAPGEQIYAVQYRKVAFKWYSSRKIETAELKKPNWWKIHARSRGKIVFEDDVLEVDVEDEKGGEDEFVFISGDE